MDKYTWFAKYFTGKIVNEFDELTNIRNDFNNIKPTLLDSLGFINEKNNIYIDCTNGDFYINKDKYSFTFGYKNKRYDIDSHIDNVSLLKRAEADINMQSNELIPEITGCYCSYKYDIELNQKITLHFVPTLCIEDNIYFKIEVLCNKLKYPLVINMIKNNQLKESTIITESTELKFDK